MTRGGFATRFRWRWAASRGPMRNSGCELLLNRRLDEYKTKPARATELIYKGGKFGRTGAR